MRKGLQTRAAILDAALSISSREGLEGLTIGLLAERTKMSKSGVFAHFGSREELQLAVIREYTRRFEEEVFLPGIQERRGLPRLRALFQRWIKRDAREIATSDCMYISGAIEYDDRPGPVRDELLKIVNVWRIALLRAAEQAVESGDLRADTDCDQLIFEARALMLGLHHDLRFLQIDNTVQRTERAFERLIAAYATKPLAVAA